MNKKIVVLLIVAIIILVIGSSFYLLRTPRNNTPPVQIPDGYVKDSASDNLKPINEPTIKEVLLTESGFPNEQLLLVQPQNGSKIIIQIKNSFSDPFRFRMVQTPEGEWLDDPERTIEPNGVYPVFADSVGVYTLQSADNPDQSFTITVTKE